MFPWTRTLRDRLSAIRTRASELRDVRRRLVAQPDCKAATPDEMQSAIRLKLMREAMAAQVGDTEACKHCVRPRSSAWPGGHCCSGYTRDRFTDYELAALRLSGTQPAQLRPPSSEPLGCAFRGPSGCSLAVAHRPFICVSYICRELQSELEHRNNAPAIAQLKRQLHLEFDRFQQARDARIESEQFQALEASLRRKPG